MNILGIETSCDETAAAIVQNGGRLLSNVVASQDSIHGHYGGIVPELASRAHIEKIQLVVEEALKEAHLSLKEIQGVCVTRGPGLMGSLIVGLSYAKALAYAQKIPFFGVDHLEAHLHAVFLEKNISYPHIGLIVSGGHTALYDVKGVGDTSLLGTTADDAAGEAFDKVAKILGLGYPGGRFIDELSKKGNPKAISFPKPKLKDDQRSSRTVGEGSHLNFSFSGLKTSVLNYYWKHHPDDRHIADIAASFQEVVVEILLQQSLKALELKKYNRLVVAGGVAANSRLRALFERTCRDKKIEFYIPSFKLCTDNAAMVSALGYHYICSGKKDDWSLGAYATRKIF